MSEYWKSTPKYWCKHCSIYVKDTPFEKKQHENTGKHQGNLKRFLRGIQNDHERGEREKQKAKAEVERLNKVVGGSTSTSSATASSLKRPVAAPPPQASVADRKKQIAQLAEMGIAVPDEYLGDMALAGQWKVVSQRAIEEPHPEEPLSIGVRKRKHEGKEEEEEEEAGETVVRRSWGVATKAYPTDAKSDLDALLASDLIKKSDDTVPKEEAPDTTDSQAPKQETLGDFDEASVKAEKTEVNPVQLLSRIPEEPVAPVFKKRMSKAPTR